MALQKTLTFTDAGLTVTDAYIYIMAAKDTNASDIGIEIDVAIYTSSVKCASGTGTRILGYNLVYTIPKLVDGDPNADYTAFYADNETDMTMIDLAQRYLLTLTFYSGATEV
jgi:hypothetical protein